MASLISSSSLLIPCMLYVFIIIKTVLKVLTSDISKRPFYIYGGHRITHEANFYSSFLKKQTFFPKINILCVFLKHWSETIFFYKISEANFFSANLLVHPINIKWSLPKRSNIPKTNIDLRKSKFQGYFVISHVYCPLL